MSNFQSDSNSNSSSLKPTVATEAITDQHNRSSGQTNDKAKATDHKKQVSSRIHRVRLLRNNAREQSVRGVAGDAASLSNPTTKNKLISSSSTSASKVRTPKYGSEERPQVINRVEETSLEENHSNRTSNSKSKQQDQPLIHTDQLNTTSPLLYVSIPNETQGDHYQAAESRVAILAATYEQPRSMDNVGAINNIDNNNNNNNQDTESSESRHQNDALTPRLVVINLEVGNSSATITWALSLHQQTEKANPVKRGDAINDPSSWPHILDPSPLEQIEGTNNKRARQQKRQSASNSTSTSTSISNNNNRQHQPDQIKVTGGNVIDSKLVNVELSSGNSYNTTATFTGPQAGNSNSTTTTTKAAAASTTTLLGERLIVKRDTIKVRPTLKRRKNDDNEDNDEADGTDNLDVVGSSTTPDIDIRLKAIADNESNNFMRDTNKRERLAESDSFDESALLAPLDREQDLTKTPQAANTSDQSIIINNNKTTSGSRLDLRPRDELQNREKNSSSLNLNNDLSINERLQLGRLANNNQTPSFGGAPNRRPPIRNQSHQEAASSTPTASGSHSRQLAADIMQYESSTPRSYITPVSSQRLRKQNTTSLSTASPTSSIVGYVEHRRVVETSSIATPMRNSAPATSRRKAKLLNNSSATSVSTSFEPPMIKVQAVPLNRISSTTPPPSLSSTSSRPSPAISNSSAGTTTTTPPPPPPPPPFSPSPLPSKSTSTSTSASTTTTEKPSSEHWSKSGDTDFSAAASSISDQVGITPSRSNLPAPEKSNQFNKTPIDTTSTHGSGKEDVDFVANKSMESTTKSSMRSSNELNASTQSPASIARQLIPVLFQKTTPKPNLNPVKSSNVEIHSPTTFTSNKSSILEQYQIDVSKWFIRLRRFASNEVDIVKIVVNNISQSIQNWSPNQKPVLRFITFKNLEPSSAYEICIESASPNQQVGDKFQILDANHFLKCHDSTDVELHNITLPLRNDGNHSNGNGDEGEMINRRDIRHMSEEVSSDNGDKIVPNERRRRRKRATSSSDQSDGSDKVKSLCKEFFTLPPNSADKINFGQVETGDRLKATGDNRSLKPVDLLSIDDPQFKQVNYSNVVGSQLSSLRRPKSLNSKALRSHIELLEISDLSVPNHANRMFEITASSSSSSSSASPSPPPHAGLSPTNNNRLSSIASDTTNYIARDIVLDSRATEQPGVNSHRVDYLSQSVIPIVGCVFGLIFIITLANILLNAISCRTSSSSSSAAAVAASRVRRRRQNQGTTGGILDRTGAHTLNSFYSDNSDNSNTSQSRIVVVGKNSEPFAAASAYFEVPVERSRANDHLSLDQASSSGNSSRGKHSSSYLLAADQARFPLGPSFEGDEKHNADMVGLARKNYDNFISHIYNANNSKDLESFEPNNARAVEKRSSHRHYHHHHHISRQQPSNDSNETNQIASSKPSNDQLLANSNRECEMERYARAKKQRIRFDKINPIYNMDGLYATSTRLNRRRSPMNQVSSFGHTNAALIKEEDHDRRNKRSSANNDIDVGENCISDKSSSIEQCPFCELNPNITNQDEEKRMQLQQQQQQATSDSSLIFGCDVENCENGSYFTCCLDKQKQRFHKQQQQLEKVMTKNGSLVPQPFINPSGPPRCASPTCESVVREHEQISAEPANDLSVPDLSSNSMGKPQGSVIGDSMSQQERSGQEIIEMKGGAAQTSANPGNQEERNFFMFGEIPPPPPPPPLPALIRGETEPTLFKTVTSLMPSTPKEPPPEPPKPHNSTIPIAKESDRKPVVSVEAMSSSSINPNGKGARETIDKTDFDQRRNQLASKLQLAGIVKPN